MPILQTAVGELNELFNKKNIDDTVLKRDIFAPGQSLADAIASLCDPSIQNALRAYVNKFPGSISETIRATLYYALSTAPPTLVTGAWAPAYDYEVTVWQAPDTSQTRGGITLLVKSRYPDDEHPLAG